MVTDEKGQGALLPLIIFSGEFTPRQHSGAAPCSLIWFLCASGTKFSMTGANLSTRFFIKSSSFFPPILPRSFEPKFNLFGRRLFLNLQPLVQGLQERPKENETPFFIPFPLAFAVFLVIGGTTSGKMFVTVGQMALRCHICLVRYPFFHSIPNDEAKHGVGVVTNVT